MITKGSNSLKAYVGSTGVAKMYKGDTLVYGGESPSLPYDAEVRYIQTDGAAYIDTSIPATSSVTFSLNIYVPTHTGAFWAFGARISGSSGLMAFLNDAANNRSAWNFNKTNKGLSFLSEGYYNFSNIIEGSSLYVGNANYSISKGTFTTANNIALLTINLNGTPATSTIKEGARILPSQIYDNGVLVRDYIPVRKKGVGYLYDRVSGSLFGSANPSGTFSYGEDVPYDAEVEYIETDGSAYINTGIKCSSTYSIDFDTYIPSHTGGYWPFGARNSGSAGQFGYLNQADSNEKQWRWGNKTGVNSTALSAGRYRFRSLANILKIGTGISITASANTFTANYNMHLLCLNANGANSDRYSGSRIYSSMIHNGYVMVQCCVPARINGVGCLYDFIGGTLMYNASTSGAFVIGDDK